MTALDAGTQAPLIQLKGVDGKSYDLKETLKSTPAVVLAFYKVSCPVCQFTFPYLERLRRGYETLELWGVSQDDVDATFAFARTYGCSFPMLLDLRLETTVNYDLTNVPSIFLVGEDQIIKKSIVGFVKADLEDLAETLGQLLNEKPIKLFSEADEVPALKPG